MAPSRALLLLAALLLTRRAAAASPLHLADLSGTQGVTTLRLPGSVAGSYVSGDCDFNGDLYADVLVGLPNGRAALVYGHPGAWPSLADLGGIDKGLLAGLVIDTRDPNVQIATGKFVGDINGDALCDAAFGAPNADGGRGRVYVVFGARNASGTLGLDSLDGHNGFNATGEASGNNFGAALARVGDVTGDLVDDLCVWATYGATQYGRIHVVGGMRGAWAATVAVVANDNLHMWHFDGEAQAQMSTGLAGAGDVNGDGVADIVFGSGTIATSDFKATAGRTYVVFGSASLASARLGDLDGTNGVIIDGVTDGDYSGMSLAGAGDVDGDGIDDIAIGAPKARGLCGALWLVFGRRGHWPRHDDLGNMTASRRAALVVAPSPCAHLSLPLAGLGDVTGDGLADLYAGANNASSSSPATAFVIYGRRDWWPAAGAVDASAEAAAGDGALALVGGEAQVAGGSLSGACAAGDVDGDGSRDIVAGELSGAAYVARGLNVTRGPGLRARVELVMNATGVAPAMALVRALEGVAGQPVLVAQLAPLGPAATVLNVTSGDEGFARIRRSYAEAGGSPWWARRYNVSSVTFYEERAAAEREKTRVLAIGVGAGCGLAVLVAAGVALLAYMLASKRWKSGIEEAKRDKQASAALTLPNSVASPAGASGSRNGNAGNTAIEDVVISMPATHITDVSSLESMAAARPRAPSEGPDGRPILMIPRAALGVDDVYAGAWANLNAAVNVPPPRTPSLNSRGSDTNEATEAAAGAALQRRAGVDSGPRRGMRVVDCSPVTSANRRPPPPSPMPTPPPLPPLPPRGAPQPPLQQQQQPGSGYLAVLANDVVRVGTEKATCTGPSGCVVVYSDLCTSPCKTSIWLVVVARQGEQAQNVAFPYEAAGVRVWAYPFVVTPSGRLAVGPDATNVTISAPSVLVYLDLAPTFRFAHPTGLLLVGSGGDYTAVSWWPGHDCKRVTTGGGCCDCGDESAWRRTGFCSRHGGTSADPLARVPEPLRATSLLALSCLCEALLAALRCPEAAAARWARALAAWARALVEDCGEGVAHVAGRALAPLLGDALALLAPPPQPLPRPARRARVELTRLLFALLSDAAFKRDLARALCAQYRSLSAVDRARRLARHAGGGGGDDDEGSDDEGDEGDEGGGGDVLGLSVQLFTVRGLAEELVQSCGLAESVLGALAESLAPAVGADGVYDTSHAALAAALWWRAAVDARYVLQLDACAALVLGACAPALRDWLAALRPLQCACPCVRLPAGAAHVELESEDWQHALALDAELAPVPRLLCAGLALAGPAHAAAFARLVCEAAAASCASAAAARVLAREARSVYLPLTRAAAQALCACLAGAADAGLRELLGDGLGDADGLLARCCLCELPLGALALLAESRAGLWARNGLQLRVMAETYAASEAARDYDLLALQLACALRGPAAVARAALRAFGLGDDPAAALPADADADQRARLLEGLLLVLVQVAGDRALCGATPRDDAAGVLRREVLHALAAGDLTHSQLCRAVSKRAAKDVAGGVDAVLAPLAARGRPGPAGPAHYALRPELWEQWDPFFAHYSPEALELAEERYQRALPAPPPARPPAPALPALDAALRGLLGAADFAALVRAAVASAGAAPRLALRGLRALDLAVACGHAAAHAGAAEAVRAAAASPRCSPYARQYAARVLRSLEAAVPALAAAQAPAGSGGGGGGGDDEAAQLEARRARARARQAAVMQQFHRQQAAFLEKNSGAVAAPAVAAGEESSSGEAAGAGAALMCVLCREEVDAGDAEALRRRPIGYICSVQRSCVVAHVEAATASHWRRPQAAEEPQAQGPQRRGAGTFVQCCPHTAHAACVAGLCEELLAKHLRGQEFKGRGLVSLERGEFLCPACAALSNALLPVAPQPAEPLGPCALADALQLLAVKALAAQRRCPDAEATAAGPAELADALLAAATYTLCAHEVAARPRLEVVPPACRPCVAALFDAARVLRGTAHQQQQQQQQSGEPLLCTDPFGALAERCALLRAEPPGALREALLAQAVRCLVALRTARVAPALAFLGPLAAAVAERPLLAPAGPEAPELALTHLSALLRRAALLLSLCVPARGGELPAAVRAGDHAALCAWLGLAGSPVGPEELSRVRAWLDELCAAPADVSAAAYSASAGLVALPRELLQLSHALRGVACPACGAPPATPALCLLCGRVACADSACCRRGGRGECQSHADEEHEGRALYLLPGAGLCLAVAGGAGAVVPSPYVDAHGEEDPMLRRGRPLLRDDERLEQLRLMFVAHRIDAACSSSDARHHWRAF
eukprot:m51a1_g8541 hypothetical protein (2296) ;mRNA; f:35376-52932